MRAPPATPSRVTCVRRMAGDAIMAGRLPRDRNAVASRVTIEEVAAAAGVSIATVSRALNAPHLVSEALRERVAWAVSRLGYLASGPARALATRRSQSLCAIVPTLTNTIFADAIEAFQRRIEAEGYILLLASSDYDAEKEIRKVRIMLERGIDGLMLVGVTHGPPLYRLLEGTGVPFVQTWAPPSASRHPTIGYDNAALARLVVDHLVGLGHREFGIVTGLTRHNDRVAARVKGIHQALAAHGLSVPPGRVVHSPYSVSDGRAALRTLRDRGTLPTALIANNDILAYGLLFEAQALGIAVPGQLSIVGAGDLDLAAHLSPPLTTIRSPKTQIGTLAAEHLLARIAGIEPAAPVELAVELVPRGTTGPPPCKRRKGR